MRKSFFVALMLMIGFSASAETQVVREGNTFTVVSTKSTSKDEGKPTKFTWKAADGITYPVMRSKNGKYFIVRVSKKTGESYKQYLPKDIQEVMAKSEK